ncbi:ABC transporter substrate-binding protein [Halobaculum sp. MBLA0143]|uniref:ABC transporter substrate-binding protein n=1 Tax=Halobaculum sp. MBLA0143 TaxID=3079933 RepID=UPI0035240389
MPYDNSENGSETSDDRRRFLKYLSATSAAVGLAGCSSSSGGSTETATEANTPTPEPVKGTDTPAETEEGADQIPKGGTFKVSSTSTANGLNVFRIGDGNTSDRVSQVMDFGFERNSPEYEDVFPLWFESFDVSDDLTTITYKLRDNLEWGNGYGQFTAEDWVYSIENIFTADWASYTYSYLFTIGKNNDPIEINKVDKLTLEASIPDSRPFFPYNEPLGGIIPIPKEVAQPYVEDQDADGLSKDDEVLRATFNGNLGAWDLKRWEQQSVYEFERAEDYYLREVAEEDDAVPNVFTEAPFFDEYHVQYFDKSSTARQAVKADGIDRVGIPSTKVGNWQNREGVDLYENPFISYSGYLGINQRVNGWSELRNKKVRQALSHIYHNEFVAENIAKGRAGVQDTLYPKWGPYYPDDVVSFEGSLDKARQLLKEGTSSDYGYSGDTFVGPDGNQLELDLAYVSDETDDLRASYLKERLSKVGIKLNINTTSWTSLLSNYFRTNNPAEGVTQEEIGYGDDNARPSTYNFGPYDEAVSSKSWDLMLTLGFSYGPLTPAGTITALFGEKENFNAYGYAPDRDLVGLREQARTADSREAAQSTITEMLQYLSEERPVVFEYNPINYTAYRSEVLGKPDNPAASYYVDQEKDRMYFSDGNPGR